MGQKILSQKWLLAVTSVRHLLKHYTHNMWFWKLNLSSGFSRAIILYIHIAFFLPLFNLFIGLNERRPCSPAILLHFLHRIRTFWSPECWPHFPFSDRFVAMPLYAWWRRRLLRAGPGYDWDKGLAARRCLNAVLACQTACDVAYGMHGIRTRIDMSWLQNMSFFLSCHAQLAFERATRKVWIIFPKGRCMHVHARKCLHHTFYRSPTDIQWYLRFCAREPIRCHETDQRVLKHAQRYSKSPKARSISPW